MAPPMLYTARVPNLRFWFVLIGARLLANGSAYLKWRKKMAVFSGGASWRSFCFAFMAVLIPLLLLPVPSMGEVLHQAAFRGQTARLEILVASGGDINEMNNYDATPLHFAVLGEKLETVEWLIKQKADVSTRDQNGMTPLAVAVRQGFHPIAMVLIQGGADVNTRDNHGGTPLIGAAYHGNLSLVRLLINRGAEINATNDKGLTALHMAAMGQADAVMELLMKNGADVNAQDGQGETPLNLIKNETGERLLRENGARWRLEWGGALSMQPGMPPGGAQP